MSFLLNPHLDLITSRIETPRCVLVPFSLDGTVDIYELTDEFCRANRDLYVSPFLPTYEQERDFVKMSIDEMKKGEVFENFILEKSTSRLLGTVGLSSQEEYTMNLGLWIRVDEHGKGYATEVYAGLIEWARENVRYDYLKHSLHPNNVASCKLAERFGGVLQDEKTERGSVIYHIPLR